MHLMRIPAEADLGPDESLRALRVIHHAHKVKERYALLPDREREREREQKREREGERERVCVRHPPALATPLDPKQLGGRGHTPDVAGVERDVCVEGC